MSSTKRVEQRLIEQGADAFSILGSFPSRKKAREAEKSISARMHIPQSHKQEFLLRNLAKAVDIQGIEALHETLRTRLSEAFGLSPEPLRQLDRYPIEQPLRQMPHLVESWGKHKGDYIGVKGRWLVFDSGSLNALNLSDLPARFVSK